jgi:radical SAM superfamily enzyme YgiQ (UPF0313 family)
LDERKDLLPEIIGKGRYQPHRARHILCVSPIYSRSFGTFHHAFPLMKGVHAFMPPQGILVVASYLPKTWEVRFVDENVRPVTEIEYEWADAVLVSGMHIQQPHIKRVNQLAHQHGKITVLGGPSVSACPEYYPDFDVLHLGELGDATEELIEYLDQHRERPARQIHFQTRGRLPLDSFPVPAYELINLESYFIASIQFSSGCPYTCEFCDIPELYGRNPRLKKPEQVLRELDAMLESGNPGAVYFVDDNFVGNRQAALDLVPHLISWQKQRGYPVEFACEATLNMVKNTELLELMREAHFCTVFCGIETPEPKALKAMSKAQNLAVPMLESIRLLNNYGMEVVSGIIIGLDTDTAETEENILEFIRLSQIPMLTINLLHALPKTPLWRRLQKENRLVWDEGRESNVRFRLPYEQVVEMWRSCVVKAYDPDLLYQRFLHNVKNTYSRRVRLPYSSARINMRNLRRALSLVVKIFLKVGFRSHYRRTFWKMARTTLKSADVESFIHVSLVAHHLIEFAKECEGGEEAGSFYAQKVLKQAA